MYPRDGREPEKPGKLRLMYEANPMAMMTTRWAGAVVSRSLPKTPRACACCSYPMQNMA
jgi:fructose-1,6-bisphosphatase